MSRAKPQTPTNSIDDAISEMWDICLELDDESNVNIHCWHDMWWGVFVDCAHGKWRGVSNGTNDLSRGFERALEAFKQGHEGVEG